MYCHLLKLHISNIQRRTGSSTVEALVSQLYSHCGPLLTIPSSLQEFGRHLHGQCCGTQSATSSCVHTEPVTVRQLRSGPGMRERRALAVSNLCRPRLLFRRHLCRQPRNRRHKQDGHLSRRSPLWLLTGTPFDTFGLCTSWATRLHSPISTWRALFIYIYFLPRGLYIDDIVLV
jgi:hypothetical protein